MHNAKSWMDRHLATTGFVIFVVGLLFLVLGVVGLLGDVVSGPIMSVTNTTGFATRLLFAATRMDFSLGLLLAPVGAALYCLGRFLEVAFVTIVGFERTPPSELLVKGPDQNNVVWIGKPYPNLVEAELAQHAFAQRLGPGADKTRG